MLRFRPSLLVASLMALTAGTSVEAQTLTVDRTELAPNRYIRVSFTALDPMATGWIGLFRSSVPHAAARASDEFDLTYDWTGQALSGNLRFRTPEEVGSYDFRMFSGSNGDELASVSFTVSLSAPDPEPSLTLDRNSFAAGESFTVSVVHPSFPDRAWIGLVRADVPHADAPTTDAYDLSYQYLSSVVDGVATFTAPTEDGQYELRMFDDYGGQEAAYVALSVDAAPAPEPAVEEQPRIPVTEQTRNQAPEQPPTKDRKEPAPEAAAPPAAAVAVAASGGGEALRLIGDDEIALIREAGYHGAIVPLLVGITAAADDRFIYNRPGGLTGQVGKAYAMLAACADCRSPFVTSLVDGQWRDQSEFLRDGQGHPQGGLQYVGVSRSYDANGVAIDLGECRHDRCDVEIAIVYKEGGGD